MSCLRLHSRCGVPTAPRKYLVVTMFAALTDQKSGNSTPRCSKLIEPSRQFVMTTSRRSQLTSSYGCTPAVVYTRSTTRPLRRYTGPESGAVGVPVETFSAASVMCGFLPWWNEWMWGLRSTFGMVAVLGAQVRDRLLEVVDGAEGLVDRGEAQVGDLVEVAQRTQDGQADLVAGHLGGAGRPDGLLHALRELGECVLVHRAALAGAAHAGDHLLAAERLGDAAAFDHGQRRLLHGGEALAALLAGPAAPDHLALVDLARIDDAGIGVTAVRAPHGLLPLPFPSPGRSAEAHE